MRLRNAKEIGASVRERRIKLEWNQAELAKRVGVSRLWIVLLEKGKSTAQLGLVLRTLGVLGLHLEATPDENPSFSGKIDLDKLLKSKTGRNLP